MAIVAIGLMASMLIGGMVTATSSGKKIAKKKCENQQTINSYNNSLSSINNEINGIAADYDKMQTYFQQNQARIEKMQQEVNGHSKDTVMQAQIVQNELYRISVIFSILFGTIFIVLLIKFISRQYIVAKCPYANMKYDKKTGDFTPIKKPSKGKGKLNAGAANAGATNVGATNVGATNVGAANVTGAK
jgi:hypothetical protein